MRGWTVERGVYLGNCDLFVCTRAEYPSLFFDSPPITLYPPPMLSLLLIPQWGPIPLSDGPGAVSATLALAVKSGGPNLPLYHSFNAALS